tara:strand:+ start:70 stop:417 length:348 start_codon:yes stop_codon:yes gene_type:complete
MILTKWEVKSQTFPGGYPTFVRRINHDKGKIVIEVFETDNLTEETWTFFYREIHNGLECGAWKKHDKEYGTAEAAQFVADVKLSDMGVEIENPLETIAVRQGWFFEEGKAWNDVD